MEPVELPLYQGVGKEGILVYVLGVTYSRILVKACSHRWLPQQDTLGLRE